MNHLAHALLAGSDPDWILGGLLGDFVHGPVPTNLREGVGHGIRLHRAIDVYTDAHPVVVALRGRFVPPFRRYAGILIDVWFDHVLARDFARWSDAPLDVFSDLVNDLLRRHRDELPPNLQRFADYMRRAGLPAAYADSAVVGRALAGVGTRLSRANPLAQALPVLQALDAELRAGFDVFFPDLVAFADRWRSDAIAGRR
ncbi:MAG TPA: ACP phosphodiesterase [Tahibacter sp.]|uniref:acyl carrier protein phosphodiesterase n=1 Tax=Tahibacter sp. TaxID=2056211 RepID=UPI002C37CD0E|nr:ACP phosphodiesterase [Tahibacter sp.]HSX62080.1 ACP phosphodiesterase [Tahibacter sp.]